MKHVVVGLAGLALFGCGNGQEASAPPATEPAAAIAPEPQPEPEPEIVETRYPPDFPWGDEVGGFAIRHLYGPGEFRELCERTRGRFEVGERHAVRGDLICTYSERGRATRIVALADQTRAGHGSCSWRETSYLAPRQATDDVIGPYFRDLMALNAQLQENGVFGPYEGMAGAHIRWDGSPECWETFSQGNFDCVRRGHAGASLMTSIGTHRSSFDVDGTQTVLQRSLGQVSVSIRHSTEGETVILSRTVHVSQCQR